MNFVISVERDADPESQVGLDDALAAYNVALAGDLRRRGCTSWRGTRKTTS